MELLKSQEAMNELKLSLLQLLCKFGWEFPQRVECFSCSIHQRSAIIHIMHWDTHTLTLFSQSGLQLNWAGNFQLKGNGKDRRQKEGELNVCLLHCSSPDQTDISGFIITIFLWSENLRPYELESGLREYRLHTENTFKATLESLYFYSHIFLWDWLDQACL